MSKTERNVREAFTGESEAYQRYLAFAQRAADEYKEGVFKLFYAVATSEKIHAQRHLGYMKGIGNTTENLKQAVDGEMQVFKNLYPKMISDARQETEEGPAISFSHANEVERSHLELFKEALQDPEKFPVQDYFLCYACGYVVPEEPPDRCPVCGAVKKSFHKVI